MSRNKYSNYTNYSKNKNYDKSFESEEIETVDYGSSEKEDNMITFNEVPQEFVESGNAIDVTPTHLYGKIVNCKKVYVRQGPGKHFIDVIVINEGDTVEIKNEENGWYHIYTTTGAEGYIMTDFVELIA